LYTWEEFVDFYQTYRRASIEWDLAEPEAVAEELPKPSVMKDAEIPARAEVREVMELDEEVLIDSLAFSEVEADGKRRKQDGAAMPEPVLEQEEVAKAEQERLEREATAVAEKRCSGQEANAKAEQQRSDAFCQAFENQHLETEAAAKEVQARLEQERFVQERLEQNAAAKAEQQPVEQEAAANAEQESLEQVSPSCKHLQHEIAAAEARDDRELLEHETAAARAEQEPMEHGAAKAEQERSEQEHAAATSEHEGLEEKLVAKAVERVPLEQEAELERFEQEPAATCESESLESDSAAIVAKKQSQKELLVKSIKVRLHDIWTAEAEQQYREEQEAAAKAEQERLEKEAAEQAEREHWEKQKLAEDLNNRLEQLAAQKAQRKRSREEAAAKAEQNRLAQKAAAEAEQELLEQEAAAKAEQKRLEQEAAAKVEQKRLEHEAAAKAEEERLELEAAARAEQERLEREASAKAEQERLEQEAATPRAVQAQLKQLAAAKAKQERLEQEAAAKANQEAEARAEQERLEKELAAKAEGERLEHEAAAKAAEQEAHEAAKKEEIRQAQALLVAFMACSNEPGFRKAWPALRAQALNDPDALARLLLEVWRGTIQRCDFGRADRGLAGDVAEALALIKRHLAEPSVRFRASLVESSLNLRIFGTSAEGPQDNAVSMVAGGAGLGAASEAPRSPRLLPTAEEAPEARKEAPVTPATPLQKQKVPGGATVTPDAVEAPSQARKVLLPVGKDDVECGAHSMPCSWGPLNEGDLVEEERRQAHALLAAFQTSFDEPCFRKEWPALRANMASDDEDVYCLALAKPLLKVWKEAILRCGFGRDDRGLADDIAEALALIRRNLDEPSLRFVASLLEEDLQLKIFGALTEGPPDNAAGMAAARVALDAAASEASARAPQCQVSQDNVEQCSHSSPRSWRLFQEEEEEDEDEEEEEEKGEDEEEEEKGDDEEEVSDWSTDSEISWAPPGAREDDEDATWSETEETVRLASKVGCRASSPAISVAWSASSVSSASSSSSSSSSSASSRSSSTSSASGSASETESRGRRRRHDNLSEAGDDISVASSSSSRSPKSGRLRRYSSSVSTFLPEPTMSTGSFGSGSSRPRAPSSPVLVSSAEEEELVAAQKARSSPAFQPIDGVV